MPNSNELEQLFTDIKEHIFVHRWAEVRTQLIRAWQIPLTEMSPEQKMDLLAYSLLPRTNSFAEIGINTDQASVIKRNIVAVLKDDDICMQRPNVTLVGCIKALCANTFLGRIMHIKCGLLTSPSLDKGQLREVAKHLEKQCQAMQESVWTQCADIGLQNEKWHKDMNKYYPKIMGCINKFEQAPELVSSCQP